MSADAAKGSANSGGYREERGPKVTRGHVSWGLTGLLPGAAVPISYFRTRMGGNGGSYGPHPYCDSLGIDAARRLPRPRAGTQPGPMGMDGGGDRAACDSPAVSG